MADGKSFVFVGQIIHSISLNELEIIDNGILVVADRFVAAVEKNVVELDNLLIKYQIPSNQVIHLSSSQFVIPGFVDTHIHAAQYLNAGLGTDLPLLEWLQTYTFPLEKKFSQSAFAEKVYNAVVKQTLSSGTTTACYFATIHADTAIILANIAESQNQRAFVGKVNMNVNSPDDLVESLDETLKETEKFVLALEGKENVRPIITPRFAITCDMKAMTGLAKIAKSYNVHIQSHISENLGEIATVAAMFPDCPNYASVYDQAGLLTPKTILAHGVHLTDDEIVLLRDRGTSISHCANSNITLQSGLCSVRKLLEADIKVGLGSDCAGGYTTSMQDAMRQTLQTSTCVWFNDENLARLTIPEVFFMATLGGAQALSLDEITGNFQVGKQFDALLVDMTRNPATEVLQQFTLQQLFQKFIYLGDDRNIIRIYVNGQLSVSK